MNRLEKTLITGIVGTSFMTAASALMSLLPKEEFVETDRLKKMVARLTPFLSKRAQVIASWSAHYGVGILFAAIYVDLWEKGKIEPSLKNGVILGAISGLVGVWMWNASFSVHPFPPNNRKVDFYLQLIPAHIVFALFTTIAYRIIKQEKDRKKIICN